MTGSILDQLLKNSLSWGKNPGSYGYFHILFFSHFTAYFVLKTNCKVIFALSVLFW
jgi:hypothetical protein